MKIAVSATGTEIESKVDPRFGRAAYLLMVDSEEMAVTSVIDNQAAAGAAQGAGIKAAGMVAEAGAEAVLSGRVGPKAEKVLQQAGIEIFNEASGTVAEAVSKVAGQGGGGQQGVEKAASPVGGMGMGRGGQGQGQGRGRGCGCGQGRGRGRGQQS